METLTVEAAAVRLRDGRVFSVPKPGRHCDVLHMMARDHDIFQEEHDEQGFLLSDGTFCRRAPAKIIAEKAGQLLPRAMKLRELYSEDVW
jgi:hypothetical protein